MAFLSNLLLLVVKYYHSIKSIIQTTKLISFYSCLMKMSFSESKWNWVKSTYTAIEVFKM